MDDLNRYLKKPKARRVWMYCRAVPKRMCGIDGRAPTITISTRKRDVYEARQVRDQLAEADDSFWSALDAGMSADTAREKYEAALQMRDAKGVTWLSGETYADLIENGEEELFQKRYGEAWRSAGGKLPWLLTKEEKTRIESTVNIIMAGTVGMVDAPEPNVEEACRIWIEEMIPHEWKGKSSEQLRNWRNPIDRAVNNFIIIVGGRKPFLQVTRQEVLQFHRWLNNRVLAEKISASTANRDFGILRRIWMAHANHVGLDAPSPFRDLSWVVKKNKRPAFTVEWITEHFLHGNKLTNLNPEARRILLALIETGCRPSEIANLQAANIHLDHKVPHIHIRSMDGREIKTSASERRIPLVGIALEAIRQQPEGFPRYFDRENSFSSLVNKYIKNNGLAETTNHTAYCLRHSFETRTKAAGLDFEMRKQLMGHSSSRPEYGDGFSLAKLHDALHSIALPYDSFVV